MTGRKGYWVISSVNYNVAVNVLKPLSSLDDFIAFHYILEPYMYDWPKRVDWVILSIHYDVSVIILKTLSTNDDFR